MAALLFMLRLMAIAFLGHADKVAQDRLNVIDDINEEVDLFGWPFRLDLMDHAAKARSSPV